MSAGMNGLVCREDGPSVLPAPTPPAKHFAQELQRLLTQLWLKLGKPRCFTTLTNHTAVHILMWSKNSPKAPVRSTNCNVQALIISWLGHWVPWSAQKLILNDVKSFGQSVGTQRTGTAPSHLRASEQPFIQSTNFSWASEMRKTQIGSKEGYGNPRKLPEDCVGKSDIEPKKRLKCLLHATTVSFVQVPSPVQHLSHYH